MAKITTITNPLTGQPAQVDQLDHTAQEIDDAVARALPGGAIDITLQNKADASSVYTKEESISAETRTALSLSETATPDAALAEIARQLSESGGLTLVKLWENASLNSIFSAQSLSFDTNYNAFLVEFRTHISLEARSLMLIVSKNVKHKNISVGGTTAENGGNLYPGTRNFTITDSGATFENGHSVKGAGNWSHDDAFCIPSNIFGIGGIQIS